MQPVSFQIKSNCPKIPYFFCNACVSQSRREKAMSSPMAKDLKAIRKTKRKEKKKKEKRKESSASNLCLENGKMV